MKIACPSCATTYEIAADTLGPAGRSVRCAKCGTSWHCQVPENTAQEAAEPVPEPPPAELDPDIAAFEAVDEPPEAPAVEIDDPVGPAEATEADVQDAALTIDVQPGGFAETVESVEDPERRKRRSLFRRAPRKRRRSSVGKRPSVLRSLSGIPALVATFVLIGAMFLVRESVVRAVPDLASAYQLVGLDINLRGLAFEKLQTFREVSGGSPNLVIEGLIRNVTDDIKKVPAVRLALRGADAQEIYAWTVNPAADRLRARGTVRFRTRVTVPTDLAADIHLRFVDKDRQVIGMK